MALIIKLFGALMILASTVLLIKPAFIFGWIDNNPESTLLYAFAIALRLAVGVLLVLAAKESRYPGVIRILGYLFVIAALSFVVIGQQRFQDFITFLMPRVKPFAALGGLWGAALGGFLIYAFTVDRITE